MDYFERTLLSFLSSGKIRMEVTGFDVEALSKAMHWEMKHRLDMIAGIVYDDEDEMPPAEKFAEIKRLFDEEFSYRK